MQYHPTLLTTDFKKYLLANSLSEASSGYYISDIRVFLRWVYQTTGDYSVTREILESYEIHLKGGSLPTKTVNRKLSSLRIFNKYLLTRGYLQVDVMKEVKNDKRSRARSYSPIHQSVVLLVLFGVIVLLGSIILTESRKNGTGGNLSSIDTQTVALPFFLKLQEQTDQNKNPQQINTQSLSQITIDTDANTPLGAQINNTIGRDVITAGAIEKKIYIEALTPTSLVFITPTSDFQDVGYYVVSETGSFTLRLKRALPVNVSFNWMVILNLFPIDKVPY